MKFIYLSITLAFLTACTTNKPSLTAVERIQKGDYDAYKELDSCGCDALNKKEDKYFDKNDSLYTGTCLTYYNGSKSKMESKQIFKGELNGYYSVFSQEGKMLTKSLYKSGKLIPNATTNAMCNCDELVEKNGVKFLHSILFTGTCNSNYPGTDNKYMEIQYKDGLVNGLLIVYDQQGNLLTSTRYEAGKMVQ